MNKHSEHYRSPHSCTSPTQHCCAPKWPLTTTRAERLNKTECMNGAVPATDAQSHSLTPNHFTMLGTVSIFTISIEHFKIDISEARKLRKLRALGDIKEAIQSVNESLNEEFGSGGK